jgi:hypothetical protein
MFVRFRAGSRRLALSLVETKRADDRVRVRHEHIGTLGSVDLPQTARGRVAFWTQLDRRLTALGNRLGSEDQAKIMDAVHARVPMPTIDEQREVKLENAKADERVWSALQDINEEQAQGQEQLSASAAAAAAKGRETAAAVQAQAAEASERVQRIERGDAVRGGLGKPVDFETVTREAGLTKDQLRRLRPGRGHRSDAESQGQGRAARPAAAGAAREPRRAQLMIRIAITAAAFDAIAASQMRTMVPFCLRARQRRDPATGRDSKPA